MAKIKRNEKHVKIAQELLANNKIDNMTDLQEVMKQIMGSAVETMLEAELTEHLDYEKHKVSSGSNKRNGTTSKSVRSTHGEFGTNVPRNRGGSFESIIVLKTRKRYF